PGGDLPRVPDPPRGLVAAGPEAPRRAGGPGFRELPGRGGADPAPRDRVRPHPPRDPCAGGEREARPYEVPRVRGAREAVEEHDRVRRDRDPRVQVPEVRVLVRPPAARPDAVRVPRAAVNRCGCYTRTA